jgi:PAS domain-containing protein
VAALPVFRQYLPGTEFGSYVGAGMAGTQLVAFRASRTRPLVVLVEIAQDPMRWPSGGVTRCGWARQPAGGPVCRGDDPDGRAQPEGPRSAQRQRDEAQAQVAQRERELSVIFKSVQEVLFRTDAQGRLSFCQRPLAVCQRRARGPGTGPPLAALVRPESAAAAALFAADGPAGTRSAMLMLGAEPASGSSRWPWRRCWPRAHRRLCRQRGGRHRAHQGTGQLQAQLAFTELLLEVMPLPLSILDTQGRYVSVNQAWEDFTGRRRDQVAGPPCAGDFLPQQRSTGCTTRATPNFCARRPRALRRHHAAPRRHAARPGHHQGRGARRGRQARRHPGGLHGRERVSPGRARHARSARRGRRGLACQDRVRREHQPRTAHAAAVHHRLLRTGLVRSGAQPKLGGMFGDIHAAGQRMLALVNDLLDVSKIESTVGTFHLERTDVRSLVRDVLGELKPLLDARRLAVDLQLSEGPLVAKVDPTRFQQVVRNVLANAIRFSPIGESLAIAATSTPTTASTSRRRPRPRHSACRTGQDLRSLRAVQQDQGRLRRHGAGPGHLPQDPRSPRRRDPRREQPGPRLDLPHLPAGTRLRRTMPG